ncbi:hypothetical protein WD347_004481 [Vibrio parahaemolyticus]|uniref:hypothetical protein n=2 Tax=Vibrionaceae TaxID=641 RepID=UPI0011172231|nr:hypothetical protein [Vibrio parahaemolyticus]EJG0923740.1 hypothetical protein [Vibrio parahaemolyticus O1:K68]EJG0933406.1 hypothetical protein [Vibrio parahaemolyticus O1]EJG0947514.1 hypothetical protein [Vibrio parahaemolyticus O10]EGQ9065001.1 hypothetical protein [Vibrio parahaemolyticus]EGQ9104590.1 hypothetical protein [Vibrio parahaemolyticus]
MSHMLSKENVMEERFVAFIDILGFTDIIKKIEQDNHGDNPDLMRIKSILNFMNEETDDPNYSADLPIYVETENGLVEKELGDPRLTYVSDCIIISAEPTLDGFKGLSRKIHKITADLAYDGIFCRGAISKGLLFHHDKVLFGSAYIKAFKLEEKHAKFPRIIIDPDILDFFDLSDGKMPLAPVFYGLDNDGYYYQRYWTWYLYPPYAGQYENYLTIVKDKIIESLKKYEGNESVYPKYVWLKNEYNSLMEWWSDLELIELPKIET